ncbi:NBR1-like protein [Nymphaea thermarum]|nr:NBR1-like protein [Nymphaea thermarum]
MPRDLVIKVKHGNTLRRFSASVHENDTMDMNIEGLKSKIASLFNFIPEADLNITYIDEDGDVVTLINDDDLSDAIRQRLNPLRLEVTFNTPNMGGSTPLRSPRLLRDPSSVIVSGLEEAFKAVPEPFANAITSLSSHLATKAIETAPMINELVEHITKMGQNHAETPSQGRVGELQTNSNMSPPVSVRVPPAASHGSGTLSGAGTSSGAKATDVKVQSDVSNLQAKAVPPASAAPLPDVLLMDLDVPLPVASKPCPSSQILLPNESDSLKNSKNKENFRKVTFEAGAGSASQPSSTVLPDCPFSGMNFEADRSQPSQDFCPNYVPPVPRDLIQGDGMLQGFHRGVICDGCGMHPIVGPRFKSKVKEDYDLCSICYAHMGNEAEYARIDRPAYRPPQLLKEFYKHHPRFGGFPCHHGHHGRGHGMKHCRPKLESRFIQDVTILDGTLIAPNTPFTKIWRMRNSGTVPWPPRTHLLWIGGDRFGDDTSVELEIPDSGFPVDQELDVAVDFVAPSRPGRYTSYWRMASPFGQKFGQRVWVLIQVEPPEQFHQNIVPDLSGAALTLNLPLEYEGQKQKNVQELMDVDLPAPPHKDVSGMDMSSVSIPLQSAKSSELGARVEISNGANKPSASVLNTSSPSAPFVPYPVIDVDAGSSDAKASAADSIVVPVSAAATPEGGSKMETANDAEEALLKELAEMGFKQVDLNKEVLRRNEYDLQQSLDDLCSASEWDTILEELQEMGFHDRETNRKLLQKNGGSIKRVVMDLLSGEK